MATRTQAGGKPTRAAQVASAKKALKLAQANLARAEAADAPPEDDEDVEDQAAEPTENSDEEGAGEEGGESIDDQDESQAIAASSEAKTHPQLALAAIQSGMSLKQFQATATAAGAVPRVSRLDAAMNGSRRLTPDTPGASAQGLGGALVADAQRRRAAATARGR